MAIRKCPICTMEIESFGGTTLKYAARRHYFVVHDRKLNSDEEKKWKEFFDKLPGGTGRFSFD